MATLDLRSLIGKFNPICRQALEGASGLCVARTHYNVEVEHWLIKLVEAPDSDIRAIFRFYSVDPDKVLASLNTSIDKFKTGNGRLPNLSQQTTELIRESWLVASVEHGATQTRSGHVLMAMMNHDILRQLAVSSCSELEPITRDSLNKELPNLLAESSEGGQTVPTGGATPDQATATGPTQTPALDQFTIDLTARAKAGQIDPVLGRDAEIRQLADILTRRRQNNPILTGEAGVGKTAVVEGFAQRIANEDVPPALRSVSLRTLDLGLLQAGAGVRGEFENRLKSVIEEVKRSPSPIILFIDEAHTMIGAGGQAGQGDAANLLKPALARGDLRTIAATTWAEYKKYFETDAALARRFQVVKVEEPDDDIAVEMMQGLVGTLESHHDIEIIHEAVTESVKLSRRYMSGRQLPDKSVSLLDTACARVAIGHTATPARVEDCQRRVDRIQVSIDIHTREQAAGADHSEKIAELQEERDEAQTEWHELNERWQKEKELVLRIKDARRELSDAQTPSGEDSEDPGDDNSEPSVNPDELRNELAGLNDELQDLQGDSPLMQPYVDGQTIAEVIADWTGIPAGRMQSDEIDTILNLRDKMEERVVGQSHALEAIAQRIRTSRANLTDPRRPIGVFFLVGPSGVGKTETAITLAELLYGGEQNMTVINMSEFKGKEKASMLTGSTPGLVGYGEGGVLTNAVRRNPYSVVLLDEIEKADPEIHDIFYQVFDKGMLRDGTGRDVDFKNTVIIMTSNAGTDTIMSLCEDPETSPDPEGLTEAMHPELLKTFKPAFLGRVTIVPYFPLTDTIMREIVELQLGRVAKRVRENYRAEFVRSDAVVDSIVARCTEVESGARNVDRILTGTMLPELSAEFLNKMAAEEPINRVTIDVNDAGDFTYTLE